jgi:hypothetical protein
MTTHSWAIVYQISRQRGGFETSGTDYPVIKVISQKNGKSQLHRCEKLIRQFTYNITLRRVRVIIVGVEKQYVLNITCV